MLEKIERVNVRTRGHPQGPGQIEVDGDADFFQCNRQLIFHRLDGDVHDLSSFLVFKIILPDQIKNHFTTCRQRIDRNLDPVHHLRSDHQLFRIDEDLSQ